MRKLLITSVKKKKLKKKSEKVLWVFQKAILLHSQFSRNN